MFDFGLPKPGMRRGVRNTSSEEKVGWAFKGLAGSGTQGARRFWIAFFLYDEKIPRLMQKRFDRTPNRKKGQRGFWQGGGKCKGAVCRVSHNPRSGTLTFNMTHASERGAAARKSQVGSRIARVEKFVGSRFTPACNTSTRLTGPKRPRRTLTADARPSLKGRLASVAVRTPPALAHASPCPI